MSRRQDGVQIPDDEGSICNPCPDSRQDVHHTFLSCWLAGHKIIITTHYMDEAQTLCDRIAIMDAGKIIALDTAAGLIARLGAQTMIDCHLGGMVTSEAIRELPHVTEIRQSNERFVIYSSVMQSTLVGLLEYATQGNIALTDLQVGTPTLEDVFLDLTGRDLRPE